MTVKLPEWVDHDIACLRSDDHCDEVDLDRLFEALTIAIEALQGEGHMCPKEDHKRGKHWGGCLKQALARIAALGDSEKGGKE